MLTIYSPYPHMVSTLPGYSLYITCIWKMVLAFRTAGYRGIFVRYCKQPKALRCAGL